MVCVVNSTNAPYMQGSSCNCSIQYFAEYKTWPHIMIAYMFIKYGNAKSST